MSWSPQRSNAICDPRLDKEVVIGFTKSSTETENGSGSNVGTGGSSSSSGSAEAEEVSSLVADLGTPDTASAITGITPTPQNVSAPLSTELKTVVTGLSNNVANVVTGLGNPTTGNAITGFTPQTGSFLQLPNGVSVVQKTIIKGVSLIRSNAAANGAIAVVTKVECSNGEIVETTEYLSLSLTTENVYVLTGAPTTGNAMTGITPQTDSFVKSYTPSTATLQTSSTRVLTAEPSTVSAITSIGTQTTETFIKDFPYLVKAEPTTELVKIESKLSNAARMPNANQPEVRVHGNSEPYASDSSEGANAGS